MAFSAFVVQARQRLADLGWFMKCLKEPLASDLLFFVRPRACAENCREQGWLDNLLERLGTSAEVWQATLQKLFSRSRALGVAFTFHRERLQEAAARRGCHHLANLNGCRA